ncbi:helix-turn-helix domain-containing protein [Nitrosomonas sp. Nm132]|uniref:helix-turn-helix domain-containing protein n=1 Tax=Nitrosomonas sp. Nm132 TaxID=1881053 RepID=UPI000881D393|nr:helix-turn-helix domain-containing protein [Nitrosomonas sp. Nm132]SDH41242.1 Winged helix-turn helix [Nitrosomonas sp. Nm132]
MKRTEWLQETGKMRFEEAYQGYRKRNLTQSEAALLLGVCDRTFRRYMNRHDAGGLDALVDKRLVRRYRTGGHR